MHLKKKKILFYQDTELFPHPPYYPDLANSGYYLFLDMKRWLQGKRFDTNEEVMSEAKTFFAEFDKLYYSKGIKML